jgi:hypothetical protein
MRYGVGFDLIEFVPSVNDPTWNRYRGDSDEDHCAYSFERYKRERLGLMPT